MERDPSGEFDVGGAIGGAALNFGWQMANQLRHNGFDIGAALNCVNFTNVIVAGVAGLVLPGFFNVGGSALGLAAGTQTGLQFGSNLILWGLVGTPYKLALDV
jgi:hypothetical protein